MEKCRRNTASGIYLPYGCKSVTSKKRECIHQTVPDKTMADIWSKRKRSKVMSLIRSKGNKATELRLIEVFKNHELTGWRRNQKLPGKPDFVFRKERLCVFVDGCFWHGCPKCYRPPQSNRKFWSEKIARNRARDGKVVRELRSKGWHVFRLWEHDLSRKNENRLLRLIKKNLVGE